MGAWGTSAFDNDDGSDWVYDLEKRGVAAVDSALSDALVARTAVERVLSGSEVAERWAGSDDDVEWRRSVDDLVRRLTP